MARSEDLFSRIRVVCKHSSKAVKALVLCAVIVSAVTLFVVGGLIADEQARLDALAEQAARLEQENGQLQDKNDKKGTLEGLLEFAQDFLGLVDPDSVIFGSED